MDERPWDVLAQAGAPRALPRDARDRLEELLLSRAPYDGETDPAVAALPRAGEPRSLPEQVRARLQAALPSPAEPVRRHRPAAAWLTAAAAVIAVLIASGTWLQRDSDTHTQLATGQGTPSAAPVAPLPGAGTGALGDATSGSPGAFDRGGLVAGPAPRSATPQPPAAMPAAAAAPAASVSPTPSVRPRVPQVTALSPASGPSSGGTWVTVTGVALSGATAVAFGPDAAASRIVPVSDTELRALSPAHLPGPVSVQVTTAGGTSATSSESRYLYLP